MVSSYVFFEFRGSCLLLFDVGGRLCILLIPLLLSRLALPPVLPAYSLILQAILLLQVAVVGAQVQGLALRTICQNRYCT
jgi:hypothetical protein